MGNELQALESASNGRIVEEFLSEELQSSLQNTANQTITLTDETNQTILSVQDIVAAPLLNDTSFLEEVNDAKKQIKDTVEIIHQFDYNQSKALEELSNDVSNMQNYIDRIQSHSKSGKIQLENYTSGTLGKYQIDDLLLENTCSREDNKSYILHHKQPIDKGGEVYNLDNLMITSPKIHQNILDPAYHWKERKIIKRRWKNEQKII